MPEIRDKVREEIAKRVAISRGLIPWERLPIKQTKECGAACQEDCLREADEILSIPELAIVDREARMPLDDPYGTSIAEITLFDSMHKAGWVKEVKE